MRKVRPNIIGCIILFLTLFVTWVTPVHADNTVAQLTLHAYGTALGSSNGDVGHAFLGYKKHHGLDIKFPRLSYTSKRNDYGIHLAG